jgi:biotin synthase
VNQRSKIQNIFLKPLKDLISDASRIHSENFPNNEVQLSSLLSVKTGGCPENCSYCPQSAHYKTEVVRKKLMELEDVKLAAMAAKANGATRFCMGAAWREVQDGEDFNTILDMVREVKNIGLQVCCTLGMLSKCQAEKLRAAGLYAYNHNIDSSRSFYSKVISTRIYDDRLQTIQNVRDAGLTVCTGGIIGMGETDEDRIDFLWQLSNFSPHPESVTINALIPIKGTPLEEQEKVATLDIVRVIATARCLMPKSMIRLSAGRKGMSAEGQFLCMLAGANSIFLGETLLTSSNPSVQADRLLFQKTGITAVVSEVSI